MIKIGIVDDDELYLSTLKLLLKNEHDIDIVATAMDFDSAVELGLSEDVDVILMDCTLSPKSPDEGIKATQIISAARQDAVKIIFLTSMDDKDTVVRAFIAGAVNYIAKENYQMISDVIRITQKGGFDHLTKIFAELKKAKQDEFLNKLTPQEKEIIELLKLNYSRKQIADSMQKSQNTIKTHLRHIYEKLDVKSSEEALHMISSLGL